jgi:hypothetical protein
MDRGEAASREASEVRERSAAELGARLEALDQQVAGLASELARAKTLWPVALRSLEARLDDAVPRAHRGEQTTTPDTSEAPSETAAHDDDLLADLRESLHAMESVAEEMERAAETRPVTEPEPEPAQEAVAGGARVVPLRAGDP